MWTIELTIQSKLQNPTKDQKKPKQNTTNLTNGEQCRFVDGKN